MEQRKKEKSRGAQRSIWKREKRRRGESSLKKYMEKRKEEKGRGRREGGKEELSD